MELNPEQDDPYLVIDKRISLIDDMHEIHIRLCHNSYSGARQTLFGSCMKISRDVEPFDIPNLIEEAVYDFQKQLCDKIMAAKVKVLP